MVGCRALERCISAFQEAVEAVPSAFQSRARDEQGNASFRTSSLPPRQPHLLRPQPSPPSNPHIRCDSTGDSIHRSSPLSWPATATILRHRDLACKPRAIPARSLRAVFLHPKSPSTVRSVVAAAIVLVASDAEASEEVRRTRQHVAVWWGGGERTAEYLTRIPEAQARFT